MKKLLLTAMAGVGLTLSANAQLASGSVFPNLGTFYDIHGGAHNIYNDLAAGKTVFIDVSATWCPPCWAYHMTDQLDSLNILHGPHGTLSQDVVVYFFQGETTSGLNELYGNNGVGGCVVTTSESDLAHDTQGNWTVASDGHTPVSYPIIDDSSSSTNPVYYPAPGMNIGYFPTVYKICRDRIVQVMTQPTAAEAYAAVAYCPTSAPAAGADVKPTSYGGNNYFDCATPGSGTTNPQITFQNYSTTPLTAATVTIKDPATGTALSTVNWTGTLDTFQTATVSMPAFTGTSSFFYNVNVTTSGDINTANDNLDTVIAVYDPLNAASVPYVDNLGSLLTAPNIKYQFDPNGWNFACNGISTSSSTFNVTGPSGGLDTCIVYWFLVASQYDGYTSVNAPFVMGNYNVPANSALSFDVAYEQATGSSSTTTDQLQAQVSSDCGNTWTTLWTGQGSSLVSNATTVAAGNFFIPAAATDWKSVTVPLSAHVSNDLMVRLVGISAPNTSDGEFLFVDNLKIAATTAVTNVNNVTNEISMFPNPAHDMVTVGFNLDAATTVSIQVYDAVGHLVSSVNQTVAAGNQNVELSTEGMATGLYNVKIAAGDNVTTKQLSVIK